MVNQSVIETAKKYIQQIPASMDLKKAYLFGSYAKGVENLDSDIDIALIFDELNDSDKFDLQVQLMLLAAQIDSRIEPHPISKEDFDSSNPFAIEIKRTGIEIKS